MSFVGPCETSAVSSRVGPGESIVGFVVGPWLGTPVLAPPAVVVPDLRGAAAPPVAGSAVAVSPFVPVGSLVGCQVAPLQFDYYT